MRLASINATPGYCPQCGEDWREKLQRRLEFCPRCGSPAAGVGYDPLRTPFFGGRAHRVNTHAKLIVRSGIFGLGLVSLLTGVLLCHGGWIDHSSQPLDVVQLWVSRLGGPALLLQGIVYAWLPFRRPVGAKILPFRPRVVSR